MFKAQRRHFKFTLQSVLVQTRSTPKNIQFISTDHICSRHMSLGTNCRQHLSHHQRQICRRFNFNGHCSVWRKCSVVFDSPPHFCLHQTHYTSLQINTIVCVVLLFSATLHLGVDYHHVCWWQHVVLTQSKMRSKVLHAVPSVWWRRHRCPAHWGEKEGKNRTKDKMKQRHKSYTLIIILHADTVSRQLPEPETSASALIYILAATCQPNRNESFLRYKVI